MSYIWAHGLSLIGLTAILYAPGLLADRLWLSRTSEIAYPHLTRFVLGMLLWIALLFACATTGLLRPSVIWVVIAGVTVSAAVLLVTPRRDRERLSLPPGRTPRWSGALPVVAIIVVCGSLFLLALRPTPAWDGLTYHLTLPKLYLAHGGFRAVAFNVYSNWPLNTELLFALGMAVHDYVLATLVHWLFAVLIVATLVAVCSRNGHAWAGPLAACFFLANSVVLFEAGIAYVDIALAFFFLMAVCFLIEADRAPNRRRWNLTLAGVCCGLMGGVKVFGLFGLGSVICLLLWDASRSTRVSQGIAEALRYVVMPGLALVIPWYAKSAWYTGNPVYPFFYRAFRGADWNYRLGIDLVSWQRNVGMGRTVHDYLLLPLRVIVSGAPGSRTFDGHIAAIWVVMIPIIAVAAWHDRVVRRLAAAAVLYFVWWAVSVQQARFLIPVLPLLAAASAISISRGIGAISRKKMRTVVAWSISAAAGLYLFQQAAPTIDEGREWLAQYRAEASQVVEQATPPLFEFINRQLPQDARILFLNTNHGFFCDREYIADSFFQASQINALLLHNRRVHEIRETLRGLGITHILLGHDRYAIPYPPTLGEMLADPELARVVYQSPSRDVLYDISGS